MIARIPTRLRLGPCPAGRVYHRTRFANAITRQTCYTLRMELELLKQQEPPKTEAGSYFVANYPPFSLWTREQTGAAEAALSTPPAPRGAPALGLYLHIPFCRKRCKFCYFRVYTDKNASDVDTYMDALAREI